MKFEKLYKQLINEMNPPGSYDNWVEKLSKETFKEVKVTKAFDVSEDQTKKSQFAEYHPGQVMVYHLLINGEYAKVSVWNTIRRFGDIHFIDWPASAEADSKKFLNGSNYCYAIKPYIINAIKVWDAEQQGLSHDQASTAVKI